MKKNKLFKFLMQYTSYCLFLYIYSDDWCGKYEPSKGYVVS